MNRKKILDLLFFIIVAGIFFPGCKTGSNYEKLKAPKAPKADAPAASTPSSKTYVIRPFSFAEVGNRTEMFQKAFVIPGYKGIDFDGYGSLDPADQKSGMRTIYSLGDVHARVADELMKIEVKAFTSAEAALVKSDTLDVRVLGSETSLRMHTYGCWPIVGTVVYLFNADIYTVVTKTRLEYSISGEGGNPKKGTLEVYSEKDFSFWGSYMGFDLYESFDEAQAAHLKQIAADLAPILRQ